MDKSEALKSLMRWVRLHPYNISQKVEIIVEHFRANVMWRLGGRAKAMVVTASRKEAVRYKLAMDDYIRQRGYRDVAAMVAFSGEVTDPESGPDRFDEIGMNPGLRGRTLREAFATDEYNVMIVANKFQTGFDQPLLVAMYVDKRLADVTAVQTLSRLNRTAPGKDATFVLDFVNDPDHILQDFRKYYKKAQLAGVSEPNIIHDLQNKLDAAGIYTAEEVDAYAKAVLHPKMKQADWQAKLAPAVDRFRKRWKTAKDDGDKKALEELKVFRQDVGTFARVYEFLSQIVYYENTDLEKRHLFCKGLAPLIAGDAERETVDLSAVLMTHYSLKNLGERQLALAQQQGRETEKLPPMTETGTRQPRDPAQATMLEVIQQVNALFEGEMSDANRLNFVHDVRANMMESATLARQAAANRKDQFGASPDFKAEMMNAVIASHDRHTSMAEQVLKSGDVQERLATLLVGMVYDAFARTRAKKAQGAP